MEAPRDLYLKRDRQTLCEVDDPEVGYLFHARGQTIEDEEEATYGVSAYLEGRPVEAKAVPQSAVEDKAVAGPHEATPEPIAAPVQVTDPEPPTPPVPSESPEVRRTGSGGRRG
jgi:hypothetical protein